MISLDPSDISSLFQLVLLPPLWMKAQLSKVPSLIDPDHVWGWFIVFFTPLRRQDTVAMVIFGLLFMMEIGLNIGPECTHPSEYLVGFVSCLRENVQDACQWLDRLKDLVDDKGSDRSGLQDFLRGPWPVTGPAHPASSSVRPSIIIQGFSLTEY